MHSSHITRRTFMDLAAGRALLEGASVRGLGAQTIKYDSNSHKAVAV